jgi:2-methylaconitate cis-trans-isomerase PrpF
MASDMECANVSAGAGLFAAVMGLAAPDGDGVLRATNAGTGQVVELSTVLPRPAWSNNWRVLFRQDAAGQPPAAGPLVMSHPDGRAVDYWVLERGNVFVLANAAPEAAEPELIEQLAAAGRETALSLGSSAERAGRPKVILYSVRERGLTRAVISAACFFNGEMHNSLPGSGAMCLSSFLAASHLSEVRPPAERGTLNFHLAHPSGALMVKVHWESAGGEYAVAATDFVTPVQLLVLGGAVPPPDEEG